MILRLGLGFGSRGQAQLWILVAGIWHDDYLWLDNHSWID